MDERRVFLKHKRTGRWYVCWREDVSGRVTIEWTDDPRKAARMANEKRAERMAKKLEKIGEPCWQVAMLKGYIEGRTKHERDL